MNTKLEKLKRHLNKTSKTDAKCKEEELVQCFKCSHFAFKKLYTGEYYCANCEFYADGSKILKSTVIIFDNKFKHFNNIITQLLTDNIDEKILKWYKEFFINDICKYENVECISTDRILKRKMLSKSFREFLKTFLKIDLIIY
jgi:ribosomal protein L37AE/L43A